MLNTIKASRETVVKHIMRRTCENEVSVETALRLIHAFDEEHQFALDAITRYERACFQLTDDRILILGGKN